MQLKTLSDPQPKIVNLHPKNTMLAAIKALPEPHPTPEDRLHQLRAGSVADHSPDRQVQSRRRQRYPLVLFDGGAYGIAEMPAARCLPKKTRDRKVITAARKKFTSKFGEPTNHWKELGAVATLNGVGFFDIPHTQKPHALNFAELHPVTGIRLVSR